MNSVMKILITLSILALICSCKDKRAELPSGSPKEVLPKELFAQLSSKYQEINDFISGYSVVKNGKYGLIDYNGNEVMECVYDTIINFNQDAKVVKRNDKYGITEYNGQKLTDVEYDDFLIPESYQSYNKNTSLIALKKKGKWGVFTSDGKQVVPFDYDDIAHIENNCVVCGNDGKYGILDSIGNVKVKIDYDTIFYNFENSGISLAQKNRRIGIVNTQNELVTDCEYSCDYLLNGKIPMVDIPSNGYIGLQKYTADPARPVVCGMLNHETGKVAIPFEYDDIGSYSEGLVWVKKNDKYGYLDIDNNVIIKLQYDRAYDFSEGLAAVESFDQYVETRIGLVPARKTGFIDKYGKLVIPFQFNTQVGNHPLFKEGLAAIGVSSDNIYGINKGFINKEGKFVIQPIYEEVGFFENGLAKVKKNKKEGFIDKNGKEIIPVEYDYCYKNDKGDIIARKDIDGKETEFLFNTKGERIESN